MIPSWHCLSILIRFYECVIVSIGDNYIEPFDSFEASGTNSSENPSQAKNDEEIQSAVNFITDNNPEIDVEIEPSDTPKPTDATKPTGMPKTNKAKPTKQMKGMKTATTENPLGGNKFDEDKKSQYFDAIQKVESERIQMELADSEMKRYYNFLKITKLERELNLTHEDINMVRRKIMAQASITDLPILGEPNIVVLSTEVDDFFQCDGDKENDNQNCDN